VCLDLLSLVLEIFSIPCKKKGSLQFTLAKICSKYKFNDKILNKINKKKINDKIVNKINKKLTIKLLIKLMKI
jgi:hypothetical protein